jgi:hypothetical protein
MHGVVRDVFALIRRYMPSVAFWAIIIAGRGPDVGPFVGGAVATIEIAEESHLGTVSMEVEMNGGHE